MKTDKTGIEIKWKELVHNPDNCLMALYFYLNNQPTAALQTGLTNQPETIFIPMTGTFDLKVTLSVTKDFGRGAQLALGVGDDIVRGIVCTMFFIFFKHR